MKQEFFVEKGELISKTEFEKRVESLKATSELDESEDTIAKEVQRLSDEAIRLRIEGNDHVAICFSGGLDSSYIAAVCKKMKANFTCYSVGFQDGDFKDPEDVIQARLVAKHLKLSDDEFTSKIFTLKEMEEIIVKTKKILARASTGYGVKVDNVITVGVGAVEVAAHSISKQEKVFFSGLGSEEIFAGYERHKKNPINDECYQGLLQMYERDLLRDTAIPKALKFSFTTPFMDDELVKYALKIPIQYKINDSGSKMILRKAAVNYLGKFSERPKRAAQYGSSFDRAIAKLAKVHGFEHKYQYLSSIQ